MVCRTGSAGRERNKKGGLQAGRPKWLFPVGRGSKGTFPGRGKTMTFQGPHGRLVFLQATKLQRVAGGDSKAGGKVAA